MTWEIVVLFCVTVVCATAFFILKASPPDQSLEMRKLWEANEEFVKRLTKVESDHKAVHKLVDDTNKLMTSARLAKNMTPLR